MPTMETTDPPIVVSVAADGTVRAVYDERLDVRRPGDPPPRRASNVEPIPSGPLAGWWHADMSPLGEAFGYCLWPPRETRSEALGDEREHIERYWIGKTKT